VAENYEQYRVHGMVFQFKSNSADALNSVNTALGTVVMATQYNMLNPVFTNKQQMENYEFGCSCRPSSDLIHPIECDPKQTTCNGLFSIRLGGVGGGDPRLYDLGRFSIATVGMQAPNVNLGELWVTYQVELLKPRLGDAADLIDHYTLIGVTTADYFAGATLTPNSDFGTTLTVDSITIPSTFTGNVVVMYALSGDAGNGHQDPAYIASGNATAFNLMLGDSASAVQSVYEDGNERMASFALFSVVGGGVITLDNGVLPANVISGDLIVMTFPSYAD